MLYSKLLTLKGRNPLHSRKLGRYRQKRTARKDDEYHTAAEDTDSDEHDPDEQATKSLLALFERECEHARVIAVTHIQSQARRRIAKNRLNRLRCERAEAETRKEMAHSASLKLLKFAEKTGKSAERKKMIDDAMRSVKSSEKVDLCFMVDATASMGDQIEAIKNQIKQIVTDVRRTNADLQLRVAIVGYRDALECSTNTNSSFDFTNNIEAFVRNVNSIQAQGGGDTCEDVASGFADVLGFSWLSPTRVLFFIADAPSHGSRYNGGCDDNHKNSDHSIPKHLRRLKSMAIDVVHCEINYSTRKMIDVMNADVGLVGQEQVSFIKTLPMSDPALLTKHATKQLRQSMQKTLTGQRPVSGKRAPAGPLGRALQAPAGPLGRALNRATGVGSSPSADNSHANVAKHVITSIEPAWVDMAAYSATVYEEEHVDLEALLASGSLPRVATGEALKDETDGTTSNKGESKLRNLLSRGKRASPPSTRPLPVPVAPATEAPARKLKCSTQHVKVAPEPFATGNCRFARYGRMHESGADQTCHSMIFKDFREKGRSHHTLERYLDEMEVSSVASALAEEFNRVVEPPIGCRVAYVRASIATLKTPGGERNYFVEEKLEGAFMRYSYNTGYWEEDLLDQWLLKFALWTYRATGGFLMVSDLQGVRDASGFRLTDPVILCTDLARFGTTNLGAEMLQRYRASTERHLEAVAGSAALDFPSYISPRRDVDGACRLSVNDEMEQTHETEVPAPSIAEGGAEEGADESPLGALQEEENEDEWG